MQTTLISVIVPCFNQAQYLNECLQSLINQTYENWECIIVNDGSIDNTEEIALEWTKKDNRFLYEKKENGGISTARNFGLKKAKGQWIQFLDCDDYLEPEKFEIITSQGEQHDLIISNFNRLVHGKLVGNSMSYNPNLFTRDHILFNWDLGFNIPIHCALFSKSVVKESLFKEDLISKEDWVFWLKVFENKPRVLYDDRKLAIYRNNDNSATKDVIKMTIGGLSAYQFIYQNLTHSEEEKERYFISRLERIQNDLIKIEAIQNSMKENHRKITSSKTFKLAQTIAKYTSKLGLTK